MKSLKTVALMFVVMVIGCSHLRSDPVAIPAIEAGYPTAEIVACGQRWHGMAICSVNKGEPYDSIGLKIQGYFKGTIAIDAKNCDIAVEPPLSYEGSPLLAISLPQKAMKNCLVSVTVSPKYPKEESQDIKVYSFRGHIAIRVIENDETLHKHTTKVTGNFSDFFTLFVGTPTDVRVIAAGCGGSVFDKILPSPEGYVSIPVHDIVPADMGVKTCVIEGFIRDQQFEDMLFNIVIAKYDKRFVPLPTPVVKIHVDTIEIKGDEAVSIVSFNNEYEVDMEAKFDFDKNNANILRILTVKGRSVIGIWQANDWGWLK